MSQKEILKKAIDKAITGGYKLPSPDYSEWSFEDWGIRESFDNYIDLEKIIFSHEFAKAFFGVEDTCQDCGQIFKFPTKVEGYEYDFYECECGCQVQVVPIECWEYHLQQMVIMEDRLKYLENFVN